MNIVFRTNGGSKIGLGHIYRCISLALAFKLKIPEASIYFVVNEEVKEILGIHPFHISCSSSFDEVDLDRIHRLNPDIVVFDSYIGSSEYLKIIKEFSFLVVFDDNFDKYDLSIPDIVINGNIHAFRFSYESIIKNTHFLLGPKYLVMKPEYWNIEKKQNHSKEICITTGGGNIHNTMQKLIKSLSDLEIKKKIIIGPGYNSEDIREIFNIIHKDANYEILLKPSSLKEVIQQSNLIISATGSTVYEILSLGKIPVVYTLAENQNYLAKELKNIGIPYLGSHEGINWEQISFYIKDILDNIDRYYNILRNIKNEFDGKGAFRIVDFIVDEV